MITKKDNPKLMAAMKAANLCQSEEIMTDEECANVTMAQLKTVDFTGVETFHEFQYFTGITNIANTDSITTFTSLKEITFPENTTFNNGAINTYCSGFIGNATNLNPNKVYQLGERKYIPSALFNRVNGITEYTVPSNIYALGGQALQNMTTLKTINFNNVEYIGGMLLSMGSKDLETMIFGEKTKEICGNVDVNVGSNAPLFDGAKKPNFRGIFVKATTPPLLGVNSFSGKDAFFNFTVNCPKGKIYVPEDSFELYKNADIWKNYIDYLEPYNFHTIRVTDYL